MLTLDLPTEPYWLDLPRGVRVEIRPVTTSVMAAAQAAAARRLEAEMAQAQKEQAEVDRILEKVGREGLASLSRAERNLLKRATDRQREREQRAGRR